MKALIHPSLFFLFLSTLLTIPLNAQNDQLPNIVLLVADDIGYAELGCQGNTDIPTPNIDKIAQNGTRFTNAYVTNSYCSPSRAGMLTGRYQNRFNYNSNMVGHHNENPSLGLPPSELTIAENLLEAGYISGVIGKWHLGGTAKYHPYRQGFDEFFGFLHEGHYFVPPPYENVYTMLRRKVLPGGGAGKWTSKNGRTIYTTHMGHNEPDYDANNPILRGSQPEREKEYLTDALTREAIGFIDRNKDRPFFLYVPYNAVHSPLQAAEKYMTRFEHIEDIHRRIFAAMLANLDDSVGAIIEKLAKEKLEENTIIIFLSDNGGPTKELTSSNLPLRGGKGNYYEGGIRIPFIMQWSAELPKGKVYEQPIISLDIFPTIAAAAQKPIEGDRWDGVNLMPFLKGKTQTAPHDWLFWSFKDKMAFRKGDWKIVRNKKNGKLELYNLKNDIGEQQNLAKAEKEKTTELFQLWSSYNSAFNESEKK